MKKQIQILIALLALSAAAWGQSDRVKTVETPDSASMVIFDTTGTNILGTDVQEAIEESNPLYPNHVWISETGGNNATGVLGDPHRAFADPWGAQDSLSEENLSFIVYQGNYSYSGPYDVANTQALTKTDTFLLHGLPGSSFEMLLATGNIRTFITDVTGASTTTPRYIYIDAPESVFNFTDNQSLSFPISVYNDESEIVFRARKFTQTGGRMLNSLGAAKYARVEIDSLYTSGGVAFGISHDFTTSGTDTITRDISIKLGEVYCDGTTDVNAAIRVQPGESGRGLVDTLSRIEIKAGRIRSPLTGGVMVWYGDSSSLINSSIDVSVDEFYSNAASQYFVTAKTSRQGQRQSQVKNSEVTISGGRVETSGRLIQLGWTDSAADTLEINGNSVFEINIGSAQAGGSDPIFISKLILKDSAIVRIKCKDCNFSQSPAIVIRRCDIPAGTKLIFEGKYATNDPGALISIEGNNTDLSGLDFHNAIILNDGTAEWINASTLTTISAAGLWTNSSSTVNVDVEGNDFWGFSDCSGTFRPLQEILDAGCDTASSAELTIFFTDTPPDTIELTTSYTVVEWQAGGADGPAIALSATGDSLLLDEGIYEIHYNIQAVFFAATTDYYIQPAIRQGAGVLNKSIRTAYNIWGADEEKATHIACTFRTEISADNTPIALVLAGDDNAAGGADVLIEKAILYVEKIE